jgi:hypothetical protein
MAQTSSFEHLMDRVSVSQMRSIEDDYFLKSIMPRLKFPNPSGRYERVGSTIHIDVKAPIKEKSPMNFQVIECENGWLLIEHSAVSICSQSTDFKKVKVARTPLELSKLVLELTKKPVVKRAQS